MRTGGQSRAQSILEALANVAIGFSFGLLGQAIIFPLVGMHASFGQNLQVCAGFTVWSVIRQYTLRRAFNLWQLCKSS